jgi:hypothetical protein
VTSELEKKGKSGRRSPATGSIVGSAASRRKAEIVWREANAGISTMSSDGAVVEAAVNSPRGLKEMIQFPDRHARRGDSAGFGLNRKSR